MTTQNILQTLAMAAEIDAAIDKRSHDTFGDLEKTEGSLGELAGQVRELWVTTQRSCAAMTLLNRLSADQRARMCEVERELTATKARLAAVEAALKGEQ